MDNIVAYEDFLEKLQLDRSLFYIKTVEKNLYGQLNPGRLLDELFFKENRWLGFYDFFKYYVEQNLDELRSFKEQYYPSMERNTFLNGIRARLYRTQFGFLTEYHAFILAKKIFGEDNVWRDFGLDRLGVDFRIKHLGTTYNIHIFVDSERSWHYRNIKTRYRNVEGLDGVHVNLPYSLEQNKINSLRFLKNGFGVYQEEYLEYLKNEMQKNKLDHEIVGVAKDGFIYN